MDEPIPSTSKDFLEPNKFVAKPSDANDSKSASENDNISSQEEKAAKVLDEEKQLDKLMSLEEFLEKSKTYMLDYEKTMFLDTIDSDCLIVCAK